jgi:hypothetical protein
VNQPAFVAAQAATRFRQLAERSRASRAASIAPEPDEPSESEHAGPGVRFGTGAGSIAMGLAARLRGRAKRRYEVRAERRADDIHAAERERRREERALALERAARSRNVASLQAEEVDNGSLPFEAELENGAPTYGAIVSSAAAEVSTTSPCEGKEGAPLQSASHACAAVSRAAYAAVTMSSSVRVRCIGVEGGGVRMRVTDH